MTRHFSFMLSFALALACALPARANTPMQRYVHFDRIDYVVAGVGGISAPGSLGGGEGIVTLEGVSGTVTLALLYWNGIDVEMPEIGLTGGNQDYDEPDIMFDDEAVTGTRVAAFGANDCWPAEEQPPSAALYRADVTAQVALRGNGDYTFGGLASHPGDSANGLSLIVYFDDGNPANDLRIAHYEGMQSNTEEQHFGFTIDYAGGAVEAVLHVSDGQSLLNDGSFLWQTIPSIPGGTPNELRYRKLYDGEQLWPGDSVPQLGHGRNTFGPGLWDIRHMPLTPLYGPTKGYPTSIDYRLDADCVSLQVAQIVQPADPQAAMLSPNPFDFGDVVVGSESPVQRFTMKNLMPTEIDVDAPQIGDSRYHIVAETCSGATLAPGDTCTVDVKFAPLSVIPPRDTPLVVPFNDVILNAASVTPYALLRGAGVPSVPFSRVEFNHQTCGFPDTPVLSTSGPVSFTATNTGSLPVTVTHFRVNDGSPDVDYLVYDASCPEGTVLAPGAACTANIAFHPRASGLRGGALQFEYSADDVDDGFAQTSQLTGHGIAGDAIHADGFERVECSPW